MAWIESHTVLIRHRKLRELANALEVLPVTMMGHLHALWHSALEQQEDGDLSAWSDQFIAEAASYNEGDPSEFVQALQKHGWLDGKMIHDWLSYAGRYLESKYRTSNPGRLAAIWAKRGVKPKTDYSPPLVATPTIPTLPNQPTNTSAGAGAVGLIQHYKRRKGIAAEYSESWDAKNWDKALPYAKNILATCKDLASAIACLDQYAVEFDKRGFKNWTLKAIDDRAIEWMGAKKNGREIRSDESLLAEARRRRELGEKGSNAGTQNGTRPIPSTVRDFKGFLHGGSDTAAGKQPAGDDRPLGGIRAPLVERATNRGEKA